MPAALRAGEIGGRARRIEHVGISRLDAADEVDLFERGAGRMRRAGRLERRPELRPDLAFAQARDVGVALGMDAGQVVGDDVAARRLSDADRPGEVVVAVEQRRPRQLRHGQGQRVVVTHPRRIPFSFARRCNHHSPGGASARGPSACHPADPADNAASGERFTPPASANGRNKRSWALSGRASRGATSSPISPDTWPISPTATTRSATPRRSSSSSRSISTSGCAGC